MHESSLARARRRVGAGMFGLGALGVLWMATPGVPVLFAPRASAEVRMAGLELFEQGLPVALEVQIQRRCLSVGGVAVVFMGC